MRWIVIAAWLVLGSLASLASAGCDDGGDTRTGLGTTWTATFAEVSDLGWLMSTHATPSGRRFAVGGTPQRGRVAVREEGAWRELSLDGLDVPLLNWVYAVADDEIYVVGNDGTLLRSDGVRFEREPAPTGQDLWGVWGASGDDLWAVGGQGRAPGQATILRKRAGSTWQAVEIPPLRRPNVFAFFKVWGSGPDDVYIVGQRGALLHWNGESLEELLLDTSEDLISVWGTGPDRVAAVGGRNNGVLAVWDGATWRVESLAPLAGLNGVWMRHPDTVHVVGKRGTLATVDLTTLARQRATPPTTLDFHAVWGGADGTVTAVGGNLDFLAGPHHGTLYERRLSDAE